MIFSPFRWRPTAIRDFFAKSLKIQIAACYLWHRPLGEVDAHSSLLSAACNLFQQVVLHFLFWRSYLSCVEVRVFDLTPALCVLADYFLS